MSTPQILNLDELEVEQTDVAIVHNGVSHQLATLSVEGFLKQQLRATKQEQLEKRISEAGDVAEGDTTEMLRILRDGVQDFFPTLPVGELPVAKLLKIFTWLNELAMQISEANAPEGAVPPADESAEGNGEAQG
jgi:hypothetical protein